VKTKISVFVWSLFLTAGTVGAMAGGKLVVKLETREQ
jgi:hypothetical protein